MSITKDITSFAFGVFEFSSSDLLFNPDWRERERINARSKKRLPSDDYVLDLAATVILKFSDRTESTLKPEIKDASSSLWDLRFFRSNGEYILRVLQAQVKGIGSAGCSSHRTNYSHALGTKSRKDNVNTGALGSAPRFRGSREKTHKAAKEATRWNGITLGSPSDESRVPENPESRAPIGWHLIELAVSAGH
ncbi:hypothetical protein HZH66_000382 [Vespula vulgaris]|uniref:Uncharacterized protein n=1 Tax=Vespula vulgaris TaxID=7454 RepID=A0A834KR51_VESVU|nr:hypothetical protein HZH66_000382 [Vespula vulgaris]